MRLNVFAALGLGVGLLAYAGTDGAASKVADAVRDGDRAAAIALLKQKSDVNAPQPDGTTALHWAVRQDDREPPARPEQLHAPLDEQRVPLRATERARLAPSATLRRCIPVAVRHGGASRSPVS